MKKSNHNPQVLSAIQMAEKSSIHAVWMEWSIDDGSASHFLCLVVGSELKKLLVDPTQEIALRYYESWGNPRFDERLALVKELREGWEVDMRPATEADSKRAEKALRISQEIEELKALGVPKGFLQQEMGREGCCTWHEPVDPRIYVEMARVIYEWAQKKGLYNR